MNKQPAHDDHLFYENLRKIEARSEYMSYDMVLSLSAATGYIKNLAQQFNPYHLIQYLGPFNFLVTTPLPISLIIGSICVFLGSLYYYRQLKSKLLKKNLLDTFKYDFESINYTVENLSEIHLTLVIRRDSDWFDHILSNLLTLDSNGNYPYSKESFEIYKKLKKYYKPPFYLSILGRKTFSFSIEQYFHFLKMAGENQNTEALSEISEDLIEYLTDNFIKEKENPVKLIEMAEDFRKNISDLPDSPALMNVKKLLTKFNTQLKPIASKLEKENILDELNVNSSLQKIKLVALAQNIVTLNLIDPIMSLNNKVYNILGLLQPSSILILIKYNAPLISTAVMFLSGGLIYLTQLFCANFLKKKLEQTNFLDLLLFAKKKNDSLTDRLLIQKIQSMSDMDWHNLKSQLMINSEDDSINTPTLSLRGQLAEDYLLDKLSLAYPKIDYAKLNISYLVNIFDKLFFIKYFSPNSSSKPNEVLIDYIEKFSESTFNLPKLDKLVKKLSKRHWHEYLTDADKQKLKAIAKDKSPLIQSLILKLVDQGSVKNYRENNITLRKLKRNFRTLKLLDDFLYPFNTIASTILSSCYFFIPMVALSATMMYTVIPAITFVTLLTAVLISKLVLNSYYQKNLAEISLEGLFDCFVDFPLDNESARILNSKILASKPEDWNKFIAILENEDFKLNLTIEKIQLLKSIVLNYSSNNPSLDLSQALSTIDELKEKIIIRDSVLKPIIEVSLANEEKNTPNINGNSALTIGNNRNLLFEPTEQTALAKPSPSPSKKE